MRPDFWVVNTLTRAGVLARYGRKYPESTRQFFAHSWKYVSHSAVQDLPEGLVAPAVAPGCAVTRYS